MEGCRLRQASIERVLTVGLEARREKLEENFFKKPPEQLSIEEIMMGLSEEREEVNEAFRVYRKVPSSENLKALIREYADEGNYIDFAISYLVAEDEQRRKK